MLILSFQSLLQNQSLEIILVCIVVQCFPLYNIARIHLYHECMRTNAPSACHKLWSICDRTSKFIDWTQNIKFTNTIQTQTCQNNLRANCKQFSNWLMFFFLKLMVIHAWSCDFVWLLSSFIRKFAISFPHICLRDLPCHRTKKTLFLHQVSLMLWSVVILRLQEESPGFQHISQFATNSLLILLCLSATQVNMVEEWCWFSQINVFQENLPSRFYVFCLVCQFHIVHIHEKEKSCCSVDK